MKGFIPCERDSFSNGLMVCDSGANMHLLRDGEADLILTSPPYFDEAKTLHLLKEPIERQKQPAQVRAELEQYAASLEPIFVEMARVLKRDGVLILQTKDIRYGGFLLSLSELHRRQVEQQGFGLLTRIHWRKFSSRLRRSATFLRTRAINSYQADETEEFLVFARTALPLCDLDSVPVSLEEAGVWASPLWESPGAGGAATHPYQSPPEPVRRLILLFSESGDLVVDPFAGHGTTLITALRQKRRALGYEINAARFETAKLKLARVMTERRQKEAVPGCHVLR